jgi:hypothetical protein
VRRYVSGRSEVPAVVPRRTSVSARQSNDVLANGWRCWSNHSGIYRCTGSDVPTAQHGSSNHELSRPSASTTSFQSFKTRRWL